MPDAAIPGIRQTMDLMTEPYLARRGKWLLCDKSVGAARFAELLIRIYPVPGSCACSGGAVLQCSWYSARTARRCAKRTPAGQPVHSFDSLLTDLATISTRITTKTTLTSSDATPPTTLTLNGG